MATGTADAGKEVDVTPAKSTFIGFEMVTVRMVLISLVIACGAMFVYDRFFAFKLDNQTLAQVKSVPKIVKVNFDDYVTEQAKLYKDGKINENQFMANLASFGKKIENQPKNVIVFSQYKGQLFIRNADEIKP